MSGTDVPGRAKPTLAAIVSLNRNGSWDTTTSRPRSSSLPTRRSGTPPRRISPIVGSAKRAISRPSVVLPDPVAPTRATCWPAGMWARDVLQDGVVDLGRQAPGRVGERDVADVDVERAGRQRARVVRRWRPDRQVEHAEHAAQPGHRRLGLVEHLGELGDRFEEPVRQEDEADHGAGGQPAARAAGDTDHDDGADREHREHLAGREQEGADDVGPDLGAGARADRRRRPRPPSTAPAS